eukprot:Sspe_Gene.2109::Locus_699_Transcript_62_69_Confidence_0.031_Length_2580::g.2109::m.2109
MLRRGATCAGVSARGRRWCSAGSYACLDSLFTTNHLNLPRLPIPDLDKTLDRYIASVKPLVDEQQFKEHSELVERFRNGAGPLLQESLKERDAAWARTPGPFPAFYFEQYWDEGYLGARCPNTVHISPFYIFSEDPKGDTNPCSRAARFITASVKWLLKARQQGGITSDGGDMSYLGRVFGSSRCPGPVMDTLTFHAMTSEHIVVQCAGKFFVVPVIIDGKAVSPAALKASLEEIYGLAPISSSDDHIGVGVLTTEERQVWAKYREELIVDPNNKTNLETIETALLMVSLDHSDASRDSGIEGVSKTMLHGTVTPHKSYANRWFDKNQLVVDQGGNLGMIFEHSCSDGATWNFVMQEVWDIMASETINKKEQGKLPVTPLDFLISDTVAVGIANAEMKLQRELITKVDLAVLDFDGFGKNEIKSWKLSPDAVVQQAFQLAYSRVHAKRAPTYEACSMRPFFRGRTETIRSCTVESAQFVDAMITREGSPQERLVKLRNAVNAQSALSKAASQGEGIDRHLLALKMEATRYGVGINDPGVEIFTTDIFSGSSTWVMSTSNVTMPFIKLFGFGPVTPTGYGLGYMTKDDTIPVNITSWSENPDSDTDSLRDAINAALFDIQRLVKTA